LICNNLLYTLFFIQGKSTPIVKQLKTENSQFFLACAVHFSRVVVGQFFVFSGEDGGAGGGEVV
jgi:hypothetical protein